MSVDERAARRRPTKAQQRKGRIRNTLAARRLTQLGFAVAIVVAAVRHQLEPTGGTTASVDALCPFGAMETLVTWLTTGTLISRIHPSNLVLGGALLVATLLAGNAFCGWICPLGSIQDLVWRLGRWLHLPELAVPARLDKQLRWGRFVVLAVVIWFSVSTAKLWFADYDPYLAIFGLDWLFNPGGMAVIGIVIAALVLVGSTVVNRLWCRYLCPLGGVLSVLSRFSFLRIRRNQDACTDCTLCDRPCPVGLQVSTASPAVSADCIGCLDCVATCPVKGALSLSTPARTGAGRVDLVSVGARGSARGGSEGADVKREGRA